MTAIDNQGRLPELLIPVRKGTRAATEEGKDERRGKGAMAERPDDGRKMVAETGQQRTAIAERLATMGSKRERRPNCLLDYLHWLELRAKGDRRSGGFAGKGG